MHKSIQGQILIASPLLSDPNFFRTVVYIAKHDADGAFGLVMNRPSNTALEDLIEEARGKASLRSDVIFIGGPVEGPLLALHTLDNLGEPCEGGLWLTSDDDHLMLLSDRTDVSSRFFSGYSGWGSGQLESELAGGGWLVGPCGADILTCDPGEIWEIAVKRQGRSILQTLIPAAGNIDPEVN